MLEYIEKARNLIEKYDILRIIYLRVSTDNKGQDEEDQLPQILTAFNIKKEECLIIKARESAYQIPKQNNRILNTIVLELIKLEEFEEYNKYVYVWDLDRFYRRQDLQVNFIMEISKYSCIALSYRQKFLHQLKEAHEGFGKAMYNFMIEILAWQAEEESKKKGERLKKSLKFKNNRTYSNKGNLYGRKLIKKIINNKKIYFNERELDLIDTLILKLHKKGKSITKIRDLFLEKKDIKLSVGYIHKIISNKKSL